MVSDVSYHESKSSCVSNYGSSSLCDMDIVTVMGSQELNLRQIDVDYFEMQILVVISASSRVSEDTSHGLVLSQMASLVGCARANPAWSMGRLLMEGGNVAPWKSAGRKPWFPVYKINITYYSHRILNAMYYQYVALSTPNNSNEIVPLYKHILPITLSVYSILCTICTL